MKGHFHLTCVIMLMATAAVGLPEASQLAELSRLKDPGALGELVLKTSDRLEKISFGPKSTYFAVALELPSTLLPKTYRAKIKSDAVYQVFLGSVTPGQRIPVFSHFLLFSSEDSDETLLRVPEKETSSVFSEAATIMIRSPQSLLSEKDDEKLKGTLFATSGFVKFQKIGKRDEVMNVAFADKRVRFETSRVRLVIQAVVATPFSPGPANLRGKIEFHVFRPSGAEALDIMKKIFSEALQSPLSPVHNKRSLAGQKK
jgi:hypothetical protein